MGASQKKAPQSPFTYCYGSGKKRNRTQVEDRYFHQVPTLAQICAHCFYAAFSAVLVLQPARAWAKCSYLSSHYAYYSMQSFPVWCKNHHPDSPRQAYVLSGFTIALTTLIIHGNGWIQTQSQISKLQYESIRVKIMCCCCFSWTEVFLASEKLPLHCKMLLADF